MHGTTSGRVASALLVTLLVLVPFGSSALALDLGEWVPGLKLSPFFSQRVEYESNVFQVPSHSKDDLIFKMIPGFIADYTFGPHSLSAGYRAEILRYLDLTSQDTVHHIAVAQLRLDFPRTLLNLKDDFTRTSDPPGTELTGRILSTTNVLQPNVEYRWTPTFSTGLGYAWTDVRFDDRAIAERIDRDEHLVGGAVLWKVAPKGDLLFDYRYGRVIFTTATERDYTEHIITVGLRGDITSKLSSTTRVGYLIRTPDSSSQVGFSGLFLAGDTTYRPTERTTITLATQRTPQESTFGTGAFYVTTNAILSLSQQLLPKLTAIARLGGGVNDYSTKQAADGKTDWRVDTFLLAGAQIEYDIQPWLRAGLEYQRTSRDSNFPSFRFLDDRVTVRGTVQF